MSLLITREPAELRAERNEIVARLPLSEADLRRFAASWQLSREESRALARLEEIDFLLGEGA